MVLRPIVKTELVGHCFLLFSLILFHVITHFELVKALYEKYEILFAAVTVSIDEFNEQFD